MNTLLNLTALLTMLLTVSAWGGESHPPAGWIGLLQKTPVDASLQELRFGCYYRVTTRPAVYAQLSPAANAQMATYDAWVKSTGNALADKWASGQKLTENEAVYAEILKATYYFRAWNKTGGGPRKSEGSPEDIRIRNDMAAGHALMKKGYLGEPLSAEDIEGLRNYRVLSAMQLTGFKILPFEFALTEKILKGTPPGEAAPDFCVLPFEAVAKLPVYTDALLQDETAFLTPQGVLTFLKLFEGVETVERGGNTLCVPRETVLPAGLPPGAEIRLPDLRGRPVVLVLAYAPDVFWKVLAAPLESLNHFYGDRAHILHINICYHDAYATGPVYAGPQGGNERMRLLHPNSWEQMARMSRAVAISYPSITYGLAVDAPTQSTRNSFRSEGGAGQCVVIDAEGNIVSDPGKGWMYWTQGPYTDSVMWLNETEIALRHALGLPATDLPASRARTVRADRPSFRKAFAAREAKPYGYGAPHNTSIWLMGKIDKMEGGVMSVIPTPPPEEKMKGWTIQKNTPELQLGPIAQRNAQALQKWLEDAAAHTPYRFQIDEEVELFVNGVEAEPGAFNAGDRVAVWYDLDQDPAKGVKPIHVRTSR